ncbi:MAG TPA: hypothetical protein VNL35_08795 [Chloroflexota bacterium]|nr:hypothetical protein [Chloroflexota bacterium]
METDIPLKTLTNLRPQDLLPMLGIEAATVLAVETLELPMAATSLDTVLRLRDAAGQEYLHLVEWQGYRDTRFLWRVLGYLGWLGVHRSERPIDVTLVYLRPGDDTGGTLSQSVSGREAWGVGFRVVRLWEQDAQAALTGRNVSLAALSPLMAGADLALVEQAATLIFKHAVSRRERADLLTILGIFSAPIMESGRFVRMIGKEPLMASDLVSYLIEDTVNERVQKAVAEIQAESAARLAIAQEALQREAEEHTRMLEEHTRVVEEHTRVVEERQRELLARAVEDILVTRFPNTPVSLSATIRGIRDLDRLQDLHAALLRASDQQVAEHLLRQTTG